MGFVVPQGRERMMGYDRFEDVVNALDGAVLQGKYLGRQLDDALAAEQAKPSAPPAQA